MAHVTINDFKKILEREVLQKYEFFNNNDKIIVLSKLIEQLAESED